METTQGLAVLSHGTFTLQHVDFNLGLVVGSGREDLAATGGDGGVSLDELGHHATQRLDTHTQGHNVEQQHVLDVTGEHTALDSGTHCYHLVGVHTLRGSLAEEFLYDLLNGGDTGRTTHEDHLVDVAGAQAGIGQGLATGLDSALNQIIAQLLKFGARQSLYQVLGHTVELGDIGQVNFGAGGAGEFNLGLLGSLFQALQCHGILTEVHVVLLLELIGQPGDDALVEVVTTQVGVTIGGLNLKHAVTQFQDRDIKCTATQVKHGNALVAVVLV